MRPLDHRKARAGIRFAIAAGIALATVAALAPAATAANSAAIDEYVLTSPGVGSQEIPSSVAPRQPGGVEPPARPGVLNPQEAAGRGLVSASIHSLGQVPTAALVASALIVLCLLSRLVASRRERLTT